MKQINCYEIHLLIADMQDDPAVRENRNHLWNMKIDLFRKNIYLFKILDKKKKTNKVNN